LKSDNLQDSRELPVGNNYYGTIFLAESGRVSFIREKLALLGFQIVDLDKSQAGDTVTEPVFFVVDCDGWKACGKKISEFISASHYSPLVIQIEDGKFGKKEPPNVTALLSADFNEKQFLIAIREAFRTTSLRREIERLKEMLHTGHSELQKLIEIGISLSSERNIERLLDKIIKEACNVTTADGGSIYIVEKNEDEEKVLHFSNTRSDSLNVDFKEFTIPISPDSIAGYVALTGESLIIDDCYNIPERYQFTINKSFDESNNYRTKSMLAVAMRNQKNEITGVIQLINRKPNSEMILSSPEVVESKVLSFNERSRSLLEALGSQAAVALENYQLYRDIENLFEGFVQASVTAIESRDPTTCGHSERIATLTVGIAEMVNRTTTGPLRDTRFSETQIKEIRYAALLHDFGKVGVRENVLLKAKKLYPHHLELIKQRFDLARQIFRKQTNKDKIECLLDKGRKEYLSRFKNIDSEMEKQLETLDRYLSFIIQVNEPTMLTEDNFSVLEQIARTIVSDSDKENFPLLDKEECQILSIPKGTLSPEELQEIQSHVTHTYNFLTKIPWTAELRNIPDIAYGHHEKLDGSGYPRGIDAALICPQSRMMVISDIYDALTAADRPYKPAVPVKTALDILENEARMGKIDPDLFKVFVEGKVYKLTVKQTAR
jgi:HD-GYP domain-containing protein (c-di-GMP phosphodiesterase class II)